MKDIKDSVFYTLLDIAKLDKNVIVLSCDLGAYALSEFPEGQFYNVGVAEQNTMSVATGLALEGKSVFVYGIVPFVTTRCLEQIKMDICVHKASVCILGYAAGYSYSYDGPSHQGLEDIAVMRAMTGMTIYSPSSYAMASAMVRSAYEMKSPCYIRLDKDPLLDDDCSDISSGYRMFGKGTQVIVTGAYVKFALEHLSLGVVDVYRIAPFPNVPFSSVLDESDGLLGALCENKFGNGKTHTFHLEAGSRRYINGRIGL